MKKIVKFKKYSRIAAFFVFLMCLSSCTPSIEYEQANKMYNEIIQNNYSQENEYISDKFSFESFSSTVYDFIGTKQFNELTTKISLNLDYDYARIFIKEVVVIPSKEVKQISIHELYVTKSNDNYRFGERNYENNELIFEDEYINSNWLKKDEIISKVNSYARTYLYDALSISDDIFFNYEKDTAYKNIYFKSDLEKSLIVGATIVEEVKDLDVTSKHVIEFIHDKLTNYRYMSDKVIETYYSEKVNFNFSFEYEKPYSDTRTFQDIENYL